MRAHRTGTTKFSGGKNDADLVKDANNMAYADALILTLPLSALWSIAFPLTPAILFGIISACLISAGIADLRVGKIPNLLTDCAAISAIALNIYANGVLVGAVRMVMVVIFWLIVAPSLYRSTKHRLAGGDLKMAGVNLIAINAFPVSLSFEMTTFWLFSLLIAAIVFRATGKNVRAGAVLALTSIGSWIAGIALMRI